MSLLNKTILCLSGAMLLSVALSANAAPPEAENTMGRPLVWMDASKNVEDDGGLATSWASIEGEYIATPPEGSMPPRLIADGISGKPSIEFSDNAYLVGTVRHQIGREATFMVVTNIQSADNPAITGVMVIGYAFGINVDSTHIIMGAAAKPVVSERYGADKAHEFMAIPGGRHRETVGSTTEGFGVPCIITAVYGLESCAFYIDGYLVEEADFGVFPDLPGTWQIGLGGISRAGAFGMTGQIAEALLYDKALTQEERQSAEKALAAKYSITISE